jgi:hypothetical protein
MSLIQILELIRAHPASERRGSGAARPAAESAAGRYRVRGAGSEPECTAASVDPSARG